VSLKKAREQACGNLTIDEAYLMRLENSMYRLDMEDFYPGIIIFGSRASINI
jgi:hypothetical protein